MLDASAAVRALEESAVGLELRARLAASECHAPHLYDAEVGHVIRGHERAGRIPSGEAGQVLAELAGLVRYRYPHVGPLAQRAWELRHNLSFYDALYVALAAELHLSLLTGDARVARAPGLPCAVELI